MKPATYHVLWTVHVRRVYQKTDKSSEAVKCCLYVVRYSLHSF